MVVSVYDEGIVVYEDGVKIQQIEEASEVIDAYGGENLIIVTDTGIYWDKDTFTEIEVQESCY